MKAAVPPEELTAGAASSQLSERVWGFRVPLFGRLRIAPTLAMICTGLVTGTALITGASVYIGALAVARNTTALRLRDASRLLAAQIQADDLVSLQSAEQLRSPTFARVHQVLARSLDGIRGVRYIYILRKIDPAVPGGRPRFVFVVDGLPLRHSDFQAIGKEMATSDSTDALFRVWKSGRFEVDKHFVTDKWGTWQSGYTPLTRRDGSFETVLGVDITADDVVSARQRVILTLMGGYALSLLLILPLAALLGRRISKPLRSINEGLLAISQLDFNSHPQGKVKAQWVKEIFEITESLGVVENALQNFNRYVPSKLVRKLVNRKDSIELNGETRELAIMFTDIVGFVSVTENLPATEVLSYLNEYFTEIHNVSEETQGVLDKYMGDSSILFWGAPDHVDSAACCCVEAALLCSQRLAALNESWREQGRSLRFRTAIGIDYGEVVVGNIGARERFNYTIVGDRVNVASRVETVNRLYGTTVLATRALVDALGQAAADYVIVKVSRTLLRGFREPMEVYEIRGHRQGADPAEVEFAAAFARAFDACEHNDRAAAEAALSGLPDAYRQLPYVRQLLDRCQSLGDGPGSGERG